MQFHKSLKISQKQGGGIYLIHFYPCKYLYTSDNMTFICKDTNTCNLFLTLLVGPGHQRFLLFVNSTPYQHGIIVHFVVVVVTAN